MLAYTALDRLHDACGTGHAWALLTLGQLEEVHRDRRFSVLLTDLATPEKLQAIGDLASSAWHGIFG